MLSNFWILVAVFSSEVHRSFCDVLNVGNNAVELKGGSFSIKSADNNRTTNEIRDFLSDIFDDDGLDGNGTFIEESREKKNDKKNNKKDKKNDKSFMEKMLPMMVMPFMVSTSMIPMMMISIFFMLVKSAVIGKIGLILMLVNMFRNRSNQGGVVSHNVYARDDDTREAMSYYGYHGDEEYGAYVNKRRKRAKKFS